MAKSCGICGKRLGFLDGKIYVADGTICNACWTAAGQDLSWKSLYAGAQRTVNQVRDMIEIGVLKEEAAVQSKIPVKKDVSLRETPGQVGVSGTAQEKKVGKPVDIVLSIDKDRNVDFQSLGHPVINLEDLIQGNEMIIGDGYIWNESTAALPDVQIACEFEPAIVDPGILLYPEGTFANVNGKFEIEDPPVNLEEYAKIKRTRNGKIRFTLFLGELELGHAECKMRVDPAPEEEMQQYMQAVMYNTEKNASV